MSELTLLDGDVVDYDIVMPLHELYRANAELIAAAYIDRRYIEISGIDTDGIERRWIHIRRTSTDDLTFRVACYDYREFDRKTPTYVRLFSVGIWQKYIDDTNALLAKYGAQL